ncbi:TonB-dependent receptor [Flavobacterium sp.]|uniref:SusC/RagA family TonB-linked outer membrane protein n=1 Tax=Flavobacterium sp. TaxID=239 RepID=UPI002B4AE82E|nr:TonB-dependent receptor [Flavobacterium sp.]HLP64588.1 TonB-dependent receptor [Flavobacterium sp.]
MKKIILILLVLFPFLIQAQVVSGKVVDKNGLPLSGVNISGVNSKTSTISDLDGNFSLKVDKDDDVQFTMIGFETKVVNSNSSFVTVVLVESSTILSDVVVIGYGTAKKRDLTGSIVKVSGKEIVDRPNQNPIASLQGKVTGLTVVNSGKPGEEPDIRIRGTVSRYQTKPLYVIDGILNDNINFVNPNDIESMEILKDASSLAIFGVRGANGVIIITTKKAKSGKTSINYNSSLAIKKITGKPDLTNAAEFKMLYDEQRANQGAAPYPYYNLFTADTDWIDEISNDNAVMTINNISVSNGSDKNKFYASAGFTTDEGLIDYEEYKKFTFNINDELEVSNSIKVGVGLNGYDARLPQLHSFGSAISATPIVAPFNSSLGIYNQLPSDLGAAQIGNPLLDVEGKKFTQLNRETRFVGNVFAEIKLLKDLKFRAAYLADLGYNKGRGYRPVFDVYAAEVDDTTIYGGNQLTSVNQYKNDYQKTQQDLLLTYTKSFDKHNLTLLGGYTRYTVGFESVSGTVSATADNPIPNDPRWWYLNNSFGVASTRLSNSDQWETRNVSYLGRALYNYDGKYVLNASFRRDGSSSVNKFQNFWSFGAAWEITKEGFMQDQKTFDLLKIKTSFGQLGNQYSSVPYPTYPSFTTGSSAVFGSSLVPAYVLAYRNDANLKWETVSSSEVGIEMATLKNRLRVEAAYYTKTTKDLLTFVDLGSERFYTNAGEIESKGLELSAGWNDKIKDDFTYSFNANLTTLDNTVNSVYLDGFQVFDGPSILTAGAPIGAFYGYEVEGVYQSYADVLASPPSTLGSYGPGDLKYRDINGDGVITPEDRTVIGNPTPDFTYGFSANVTYKNWSLSADFQGVYGNEVWRDWGNGSTFAQFNYRTDRLDRWNGPGTSNWEPQLNDATGYNKLNSSYMIEDGSYLRLRNLQIGYNVDSKLLSKINIQSLRLFVSSQNLITWKNNSGFTPEAGGSPISFGRDNGGYPVPSITTLGLNVSF